MKNFYHEFEVNSNIDKVWRFYTDIKHLEVVTPKDIKPNIIQSTDKILKKATIACFSGKIVISAKWCSKITFFEKYKYVDEMIPNDSKRRPFQIWKHEHTFRKLKIAKHRSSIELSLGYPMDS